MFSHDFESGGNFHPSGHPIVHDHHHLPNSQNSWMPRATPGTEWVITLLPGACFGFSHNTHSQVHGGNSTDHFSCQSNSGTPLAGSTLVDPYDAASNPSKLADQGSARSHPFRHSSESRGPASKGFFLDSWSHPGTTWGFL